jgi:hypothetical protein
MTERQTERQTDGQRESETDPKFSDAVSPEESLQAAAAAEGHKHNLGHRTKTCQSVSLTFHRLSFYTGKAIVSHTILPVSKPLQQQNFGLSEMPEFIVASNIF